MVFRHALGCLTLIGAALVAKGAAVPSRAPHGKPNLVKVAAEHVDTTRKAGPTETTDGHRVPRTVHYAATAFNLHTLQLLPVEAQVVDGPELRRFLRCRVTGQTHPIEVRPVELAVEMAQRFGQARIEIVSGYRSSKLNELLRKKGREVASRSQHVTGSALDFRIPGVPARDLARAVGAVHAGGIGTYLHSDFVHVDVGRDRRWGGR